MADQEHNYWDTFYVSRRSADVPESPSDFAQWTRERIQPETPVLEFGFGTARDSLWFARSGHSVIGYDFAESAVENGSRQANENGLDAQFSVLDLYDHEASMQVGKQHAEAGVRQVIYGRFLIHSLEANGRQNLLSLAAVALPMSGSLFLEFRTGLDENASHIFGDTHFRNFVDPEIVVREIQERGGRIVDLIQGHGLAVYKSEDPHVARIWAEWDVSR